MSGSKPHVAASAMRGTIHVTRNPSKADRL